MSSTDSIAEFLEVISKAGSVHHFDERHALGRNGMKNCARTVIMRHALLVGPVFESIDRYRRSFCRKKYSEISVPNGKSQRI